MKINIKRFDKSLPIPKVDPKTAGFDFVCRESVIIKPQKIVGVAVNTAVRITQGYFLMIAARSSTSWKKGILLANGVGIVDPFYSGDMDEIKILLLNITNKPVRVEKGELLAQGILLKNELVEWIEVNSFGTVGHGGYSMKDTQKKSN